MSFTSFIFDVYLILFNIIYFYIFYLDNSCIFLYFSGVVDLSRQVKIVFFFHIYIIFE